MSHAMEGIEGQQAPPSDAITSDDLNEQLQYLEGLVGGSIEIENSAEKDNIIDCAIESLVTQAIQILMPGDFFFSSSVTKSGNSQTELFVFDEICRALSTTAWKAAVKAEVISFSELPDDINSIFEIWQVRLLCIITTYFTFFSEFPF